MTSKEDGRLMLSNANKEFVEAAFLGLRKHPPKKVLIATIGLKDPETGEGDAAEEALEMLSAYDFDWIAGFPDGDEEDQQAIVDFVIDAREQQKAKYKAVVTIDADDKAIVSLMQTRLELAAHGEHTHSGNNTSRIAGLLATIPLDRSCTFAVLPEVLSVKRISIAEESRNRQARILINDDGVRIARGVTSAQMTESRGR